MYSFVLHRVLQGDTVCYRGFKGIHFSIESRPPAGEIAKKEDGRSFTAIDSTWFGRAQSYFASILRFISCVLTFVVVSIITAAAAAQGTKQGRAKSKAKAKGRVPSSGAS
ncbi:hypothetical protein TsFJ059_004799 [Trichoderma semiorbis]|uniref:Uncharacterized protein n=1 Tax=Trichoderma semiorbis TaxID=1491008 RepID=A0A9P8KVK8_9HYPO|nr:hypothetical protein TsFJ059_004799 [Trichoderma semiorbis]